jgi:hypothetical protein
MFSINYWNKKTYSVINLTDQIKCTVFHVSAPCGNSQRHGNKRKLPLHLLLILKYGPLNYNSIHAESKDTVVKYLRTKLHVLHPFIY